MSRYLERNMEKDEAVLYVAQLHWIIYRAGIVMTLLGGVLGNFGTLLIYRFFGPNAAAWTAKPMMYVSIVIVVVGALELVFSLIRQNSTELVITNQRVIAKYGFIATTTYELMLGKVEGANIDQTVMGRLLGFGTIMVRGTGGGISPIDHIAAPYRFHAALMEILRRNSIPQREGQPDPGSDD